MANDLSAFADRPDPKHEHDHKDDRGHKDRDRAAPARRKVPKPEPMQGLPPGFTDAPAPEGAPAPADANAGAHAPSPDPAPDHVPGLTAYPAPGEVAPERPGKEVSADAHGADAVPIVGFVDHQIPSADGTSMINVHTPGVVLVKKPDDSDKAEEVRKAQEAEKVAAEKAAAAAAKPKG